MVHCRYSVSWSRDPRPLIELEGSKPRKLMDVTDPPVQTAKVHARRFHVRGNCIGPTTLTAQITVGSHLQIDTTTPLRTSCTY